jgi:Ca-activated chloride channel family protein
LRPEDAFNIVEFDHEASALFAQPYPAENYALAHAIRFIRSLEADGGTEIEAAFDLTLALPTDAQKLRQIIFITDGSVSNESELLAKINRELEDRRLFTVGIGSSPNRYFMEEAARAGRGTFSYIANVSDVEDEIGRLLDKLSRPALTDITIEGEGVTDLTPSRIPDLYFGEPLSVALRLLQNDSEVRISGRLVDTAWSQNLAIKAVGVSSGIRINWAREMIAQWNRAGIRGVPKEQVREAVLDLALNHHLVSDFTSLVAVDKTPVRSVTIPLRRDDIAPPMPYGLKVSMPQTALGYERNVMYALMLLLLGCCFLWAARRDVAYAKV